MGHFISDHQASLAKAALASDIFHSSVNNSEIRPRQWLKIAGDANIRAAGIYTEIGVEDAWDWLELSALNFDKSETEPRRIEMSG